MQKLRLLTGIQPSGALHLGNYFGALKPFVDMYADYESYIMVADMHALTSVRDPQALHRHTLDSVRAYLAAGIDPEKAVLFCQSHIPEHTELAWIFECLVSVSFLELAHAYKAKVAAGAEATAGLFNYPMLMAADIALYDADVVPVGRDQEQHIEYAREAIKKFGSAYGEGFRVPKAQIVEGVGTVPGTDGRKMSKSYNNTIPLFGSRDEIAQAVMRIVTDSEGDKPEHVYAIHKLIKTDNELAPLYEAERGKYKALKEALIEDLDAYLAPMRERYATLSDAEVRAVLVGGAERARAYAQEKMRVVREHVGLVV